MDAKAAARERFDVARDGLIKLSHRIHARPELGFEEERACAWLCEALSAAGFAMEQGICDLPTAFRARRGTGPLHIGICAEYDALIHPMIGINSLPAVNHQPEFTQHCVTPDADQALCDGALAMAWTCIDMAGNEAVRRELMARPR